MGKVAVFGRVRDGLRNLVSGLGVVGQSKAASSGYVLNPLSRQQLDACYRGTWLGRKVHDIPAKDMTREWRSWKADDDQIEAIENEEKRLGLIAKARKALVLSKLYGGAALIMGLPGDASTPAPPTITKGQLRYVHLMHRYELTLGDQNRDLESDQFGRPSYFEINAGIDAVGLTARIHPSRVITFNGLETPDGSIGIGAGHDWFWGDPLLFSIADALTSHDTGIQAIAELLQEAKVDVVHIPGFMDQIASKDYENTLIQRFSLAALLKSITNTLILDGGDGAKDAGETWETRQISWQGLPDVQRVLFEVAAGAADIPATRLIGQAPHGLNSTGESDLTNYYDRLSADQESDLTPALVALDNYVIQSATGLSDPSIYFEWRPLWQMAPKEVAERDWRLAQATQIYAQIGVIPGDAFAVAVQNRLIEDGTYPGLEAALEEADLQAELSIDPSELEPKVPAVDPNAPPPPPPPANANEPPMSGNSGRRAANDRARRRIRRAGMADRARRVEDATPRSLYVSRSVLNGDEIAAWARAQGFKAILAPADMHVTIAASRTEVDWLAVGGEPWSGPNGDGTLVVGPGGPRVVEPLGEAIVLLFNSWDLEYRNQSMREAGASWDFSDYSPHISITYDREANSDLDLTTVAPYAGPIRLGPEIFKEFDPNAGSTDE